MEPPHAHLRIVLDVSRRELLKAAQALGITIPPGLFKRADEVIR